MEIDHFLQNSQFASLLDALTRAATTLMPYPELIDRDALTTALVENGVNPASIRHDLALAQEPHPPIKLRAPGRSMSSRKSWQRFRETMATAIAQSDEEACQKAQEKPRIRVPASSRTI